MKIAKSIAAGAVVLSFAFALVASAGTFSFGTNLTLGSTGTDVLNLQKVLNSDSATVIATSGAGSPGNETTYFGARTKAAVSKFQAKYGISPTAGYFGPVTRAKANTITIGGTTTSGTTVVLPVGGGISVSGATQPGNSLAPKSAARVPFTKFVVTAGSSDVTVNSVTVERTGFAQDAVFGGIVLLDENGLQIGTAKTLNSNHQAIIGEPFVVKAGSSKTLTVAGNMASSLTSYTGQVVSLSVVAVNTSATVSGSLPISGAAHTINDTLTTGSASFQTSSYDPGTTASKEIGTTGYKFSGVRVTAGSAEKVRLYSIRWNQVGSVSSNDLANMVTVIDGASYPTTVSADGKYFTTIFPGGILIDKGFSKDMYIQGDIIGTSASGRNVDFDIYKTTDIYMTGETYGYGITPTGTGSAPFSTGNPFFNGYAVSITSGSATTISKANTVAAQNIAVNVPNQVLGGFTTNFRGEPVSVQQIVVTAATSSGSGFGTLTNVSIVDQNGAVVAGPIDATLTGASTETLTFTDTITFPVGTMTYTIKGKVASTIGNGTIYTLTTVPSSGWTNITGQVTGNTITLTQGTFDMNAMTVKSAALAVTVSSNPAAQYVVAGAQNFLFTNFQFDASQSGEDVRFASLPTTLTVGGGGAVTDLTSCQLFDGTTSITTGSNVVNPSTATPTFTFDQSLTITKGTVKTIGVVCNVATGASGTYKFGATAAQIAAIAATGVTSSNDVDPTGAQNLGNLMSVAAGSLAVSTDASSPAYAIAAANTTGNILGVAKFRATNEAINLQRVGLVLTNSASSSASDLVNVGLYYNGSLVGSAVFTGTNTHATSTLSSPISLPKDTDVTLTIKGDIAAIGTSQPATSGHLIAVDVESNTNTYGTGAQSGATRNSTGSTAVSGVRIFKSYPVFAQGTLSSTGVGDGKLLRFSITANSQGTIGINQFKLTIATSTITGVTGVNMFGYTDSAYSQAISGVSSSGQISYANVAPGTSGAVTISAANSSGSATAVQIPAGATYYFEVRGTVAGVQTGSSVSTTLLGDSSYPALSGFMGTVSNVSGSNLVWSPNSTATAATTDSDWTNGYGVQGLQSSGFVTTRSN